MAKEKMIEALNQDRADELAAIMQYMLHHYMAEGLESPAVMDLFKKTGIDEMKHAEALAERINYLGGVPVKEPSEIKTGGDLRKMIADDLAAENQAIANYKAHIRLAEEEEDPTTRTLLEGILSDEEGHADTWETTLGIKRK